MPNCLWHATGNGNEKKCRREGCTNRLLTDHPPERCYARCQVIADHAGPCLHRGGIVREVGCSSCNGQQILLPVNACAAFGECSLHDYSAHEGFAGVKPCDGCLSWKEREPELPGVLVQVANYAKDLAVDVSAGRPRRTPEQIASIFAEHCGPCLKRNGEKGACSVCGCPVSPTEPEDNLLAWAALKCSDNPPRWT
jgi:hypothetical protein